MAVNFGIPFARKHVISVLSSDTVMPNDAHTTTSTPIIFLSCVGDCETTPASSAVRMTLSSSFFLCLPLSSSVFLCNSQVRQSAHGVFVRIETRPGHIITTAKKMLNRRGASAQPWRRPCFTANHPEHTPSSSRTHSRMP